MWHQFAIPSDSEGQKNIIRNLRTWIQSLENNGTIEGYAFNHYQNTLNIRFDCSDENLIRVQTELTTQLEKLEITCELNETEWTGQEHVRRAMEFGSRCAFLFFELLENGRFSEDYISNIMNRDPIPYQFQYCMNHGLMNSLGIPKLPNELLIHLYILDESIKQACNWV